MSTYLLGSTNRYALNVESISHYHGHSASPHASVDLSQDYDYSHNVQRPDTSFGENYWLTPLTDVNMPTIRPVRTANYWPTTASARLSFRAANLDMQLRT